MTITFKEKPDKKIKINKKRTVTLDGKHKELINEFYIDETENIPNLIKEKHKLLELLKNENNIELIMNYNDTIEEITENIKKLKSKKKKYYLDNSKYIFEYFENKKNISISKNTKPSATKKVNDFFKIKTENENENEVKITDFSRENIIQKYMCNIDETFLDMNLYIYQADVCQFCHKGELIVVEDDGIMLCNVCFKNVPFLIENEKQSYKEPPKEVCFYAYKKINHFKEILAQFQGKETTQITEEIIMNIKQQLKKERIGIDKLTHEKTKEILKKLGYNKYYEHISFIKNKLGISPITMSSELEETLCNLFNELQTAFCKNVPDDRVNFLNYYYVLYKLCELINEKSYLEFIPLLKDKQKLIEQDFIWKDMCKTLDWAFYATV